MNLCKEDYELFNNIISTGVNAIHCEYGSVSNTTAKFSERRGYSPNGVGKTALGRNLKSIYTLYYNDVYIQIFNYNRYDTFGRSRVFSHIEANNVPYFPRYFCRKPNYNGYTYKD